MIGMGKDVNMVRNSLNILSIGGSDPSTGAGIQSDVRTLTDLGAYPLTVITAITAQNTSKFATTSPVSQKIVQTQIESVMSDFQIDGIKIAMVYNEKIIRGIYNKLKDANLPIVLDPVIKSSTGGKLIESSALPYFKKYLIPISSIITPNKSEAEMLSQTKINSKKSLDMAAKKIQSMGVNCVVITGIERQGRVIDYVRNGNDVFEITGKKIKIENHGSGCTYSSALIYSIVKGKTIKESVSFAKEYTTNAIKNSQNIGKGIPITNSKTAPDKMKLEKAIKELKEIPYIVNHIPECQTNFGFSKKNPKTTKDVLAVLGRIVKTGKTITQVGNIEYGTSKHVATAIIEVNKKFSEIRAGINLKYDKQIILKLQKLGLNVISYDRATEPKNNKKVGSSVKWGINTATKKTKSPPDVIYHTGDYGKEPMILVFADSPESIIEKVTKIVKVAKVK